MEHKEVVMRQAVQRILIIIAHIMPASLCGLSAVANEVPSGGNQVLPHEVSPPHTFSNTSLFETVPVESQHLKLYDIQDNEKRQHLDRSSLSRLNMPRFPVEALDRVISNKAQGFAEDIFSISQEYNIDPLLLHAIAEVESHYNPVAISHKGAQGLMQIMPDTARRFGMKNPEDELFNPRSNLRVSSNYIRMLHGLFGNNIPLILAAYNAGENAVIKYGYDIPPYKETQGYVNKVMKRYLELKDRSYKF